MNTTIVQPGMSLSEIAFAKIREAQKNIDKREQIQSLIHEQINLYKNSIRVSVRAARRRMYLLNSLRSTFSQAMCNAKPKEKHNKFFK
jgi:hypothetical protein